MGKAGAWSNKAHRHENKAKELEGKAGMSSTDAELPHSAGTATSAKESALENKLAAEEKMLVSMKSKMGDNQRKAMSKIKSVEHKMAKKIAATKAKFQKEARQVKKQGSKKAKKVQKMLKRKLS